MNSHPEIKCKGECFGCFPTGQQSASSPGARRLGNDWYRRVLNQFPGRIEDPDEGTCVKSLTDFFSDQSEFANKICGFKLKFPSQAKLFPEVVSWLEDRSGSVRVIVLHRKDYLRRAISVLNLRSIQARSNSANVRQEIVIEPSVFDVQEVVRLINYYKEIEFEFSSWANQFSSRLEVEYDELIEHPEATGKQIQDFLGVTEVRPLVSKTWKIAPMDLRDQVKNFQELRDALTNANLPFES